MTTEREVSPEKRFTPIFLPWIVAAGALALYLFTLNRWVSLNSLLEVSRMSGWNWQPELYGPVFWLLSYPIRWLPVQQIPLGLNVFSCVCAALTLALLARTVLLLPQDRTQEQRKKLGDNSTILAIRSAWLPPVLAALVCGLQLTFWEYATAATNQALTNGSNEMLDLLVFAYVVRCLLEYRSDWRDSWLYRGAFVYGLGITNNWAMIGFLPAFIVALVWTKGLTFFNLRFLSRLFLCILVALSLYLLLPLTQGFEHSFHLPFWQALKVNLVGQKNILMTFSKFGRQTLLLLSLTSLVPMLLIGIRWSSYFGDTSELGVALATFLFHAVHALFLFACIWVALDPAFSPRNKGWGIPFLTFYYLGALSVGYFAGYFLLVFSNNSKGTRRIPSHIKLINGVVTAVIWVLLFLAPAVLIYRNLPQIRATNGPMLKQYAAMMTRTLPTNKTVLLSDDDRRLWLLESYEAQKGALENYIFVNTESLKWPDYQRYLMRQYGKRWTGDAPPKDQTTQLYPVDLIHTIYLLMTSYSNSVYYLHPSFGYYFEYLHSEPHGLVYKLVPYNGGTLLAPPLPKKVIEENNAFWAEAEDSALKRVENALAQTSMGAPSSPMGSLMKTLHLPAEHNQTAGALGGYYSRALTYWGVELQKSGQLTNAAALFQRAMDLNPDNVVAEINLECNKNLQAGRRSSVEVSKSVEDEFGKYRSWDAVISANGPFDEPNLCFEQGRVLVRNNLTRQAAIEIQRAITLAPDNLEARLWMAQLYVLSRMPSEAIKLTDAIRSDPILASSAETNKAQVLFVETSARLMQGDVQGANQTVQTALKKAPGDPAILSTATQVYRTFQLYSNALSIIDLQLAAEPDNLVLWGDKGFVSILAGQYEQAIPPLTRVINADTNNYASRLNRAIAYLRTDRLDDSRADYEILQKAHPTDFRLYYGLAEIAWKTKDNKTALRNYELYLSNANTNTAEAKIVMERVQKLKSGSGSP